MGRADTSAAAPAAAAAVPRSRSMFALLFMLAVLLASCQPAESQIGKPMPWPVPDPPPDPSRKRAAVAVLGSTCGNTVPPGYTFLPNTRTTGHGLRFTSITGTSQYAWQLLAAACDSEALCVSVHTNGWMIAGYPRKWPVAPIGGMNAWGWLPREQDVLCQGTLVKQGLSCGQVSICRPNRESCKGSSSAAPWQYNCTCQQGQRLNADGYICTSPPFKNDVVFVDDQGYPDQLFRVVDPKYRSSHVWLYKGSRLAIALVIDVLATQEPAMAEYVNLGLGPLDVLPAMSLIIQNLQRVLTTFDRLLGMAPPAPIESYELLNTTLDQRLPYEVSMSDTENVYYTARWGSAGFMTTAPPLLDMLTAAMKNQSVLSRATLRTIPINYVLPHIFNSLEYGASNGVWAGHSYCVLDAAMTITISTRLPNLRLVGHSKNFTYGQLLAYWEASALAILKQGNYSWSDTWHKGTSLGDEFSQMRLLASGVFVHLYRKYGRRQYSFLQRFFHSLYELADRVPAYMDDSDRFRGTYFIAASMAAPDKDMLPFFTQRLKWDISQAALQYLGTTHGLPKR